MNDWKKTVRTGVVCSIWQAVITVLFASIMPWAAIAFCTFWLGLVVGGTIIMWQWKPVFRNWDRLEAKLKHHEAELKRLEARVRDEHTAADWWKHAGEEP